MAVVERGGNSGVLGLAALVLGGLAAWLAYDRMEMKAEIEALNARIEQLQGNAPEPATQDAPPPAPPSPSIMDRARSALDWLLPSGTPVPQPDPLVKDIAPQEVDGLTVFPGSPTSLPPGLQTTDIKRLYETLEEMGVVQQDAFLTSFDLQAKAEAIVARTGIGPFAGDSLFAIDPVHSPNSIQYHPGNTTFSYAIEPKHSPPLPYQSVIAQGSEQVFWYLVLRGTPAFDKPERNLTKFVPPDIARELKPWLGVLYLVQLHYPYISQEYRSLVGGGDLFRHRTIHGELREAILWNRQTGEILVRRRMQG
ncbi:hypothetical protein [Niveispirillum sp. KHB5.9]|uniref:hypothetical protein n=1 Tax=Niveispirillum sp. KHB5.9 TaxID=3400269 RepID=UPI003A8BB120